MRFERSGRGQEPSRGHKFSILENLVLHRDFTSSMRLHFRSDLVGVALVGARPLHLLSQTALPLKSPTGAFIAPLRFANAVPPQTLLRTDEEELCQFDTIPPTIERNRKFPSGNSLPYLSCVDFCRVRLGGRTLFFSVCLTNNHCVALTSKDSSFLMTLIRIVAISYRCHFECLGVSDVTRL